jgi:dipeptidyl aminopeptidase/acylaminoacyl peptidase
MQDDLTWGVKYLIANGTADPKRVGIMGGSYGGYATLAGVTFTPDVYSGAVAIVAPSNLQTLLQSIPPIGRLSELHSTNAWAIQTHRKASLK